MLEVLLSFGGIEALIPLIIVVILIGTAAGLTRKFDFLAFLGISAFAGAGSGFAGRGSIKGKSAYGRTAGKMLADKAPVKAKALVGKQQKKMQTNSQMKQERERGMNGAPGTAQAGGGESKTPNTGKQLAPQKYGRVKMALGYLPSVAGLSWMSGLMYGRKGQKYKKGRLVIKVKPTGGAVLTKEGQVRPIYGKIKDRIRNRGQPVSSPQAAGAAAPAFAEELSKLEEKRKKLNDEYNKKMKDSAEKYANLGNGRGDSERKERRERDAHRDYSFVEHENAVIDKRIEKLKNADTRWKDTTNKFWSDAKEFEDAKDASRIAAQYEREFGNLRARTDKELKGIQTEAYGNKKSAGRLKDFLSDNAKIVGAAGNANKISDITAEIEARKAYKEKTLPTRGMYDTYEEREDWKWERDRRRREKENAHESR